MTLELSKNMIKVLILDVSGLYTTIYDELYCDVKKYSELVSLYHNSNKYRVIKI